MPQIPDVSRLLIENTPYNIKDAAARTGIEELSGAINAMTINGIKLFNNNRTHTSSSLKLQDEMDAILNQEIDVAFQQLNNLLG